VERDTVERDTVERDTVERDTLEVTRLHEFIDATNRLQYGTEVAMH